jgi:hypothetical protein
MRGEILVLIFGGHRHPRGEFGNLAEDRPFLQHQPNLAVLLHHLLNLGCDLAAIRAIVVGPFHDIDVAVRVAHRGNIRVAQHQRFGQHVFALRQHRARAAEQGRTGAEQADGFTPGEVAADCGRVVRSGHLGSFAGSVFPVYVQDRDMLRASI